MTTTNKFDPLLHVKLFQREEERPRRRPRGLRRGRPQHHGQHDRRCEQRRPQAALTCSSAQARHRKTWH